VRVLEDISLSVSHAEDGGPPDNGRRARALNEKVHWHGHGCARARGINRPQDRSTRAGMTWWACTTEAIVDLGITPGAGGPPPLPPSLTVRGETISAARRVTPGDAASAIAATSNLLCDLSRHCGEAGASSPEPLRGGGAYARGLGAADADVGAAHPVDRLAVGRLQRPFWSAARIDEDQGAEARVN